MSERVVQVIAHRGMGQAFVQADAPPENTLPAFAQGWNLASACELDVHLTKDGQVIVIHDKTTDRTTNASLIVRDCYAAELRSLDAGRWKSQRWAGTRLPLLDDVLEIMPAGRELQVELKDGPQVVSPAVELVRRSEHGSQVTFISFDVDSIAAAKREMPDNNCLLLIACEADYSQGRWNVLYAEGPGFRTVKKPLVVKDLVALVTQYGLNGIGMSFAAPPALVSTLASEGLRTVAWTVNEPDIALDLVRMGLDAITTDQPALIAEAIAGDGFKVR